MKNIKITKISAPKKKLFSFWLEFLKPFHKLRDKEVQALSLLFYYEHEIIKEVGNDDPDLVKKLLFSRDSKNRMKAELGYKDNSVFNNLLSSLRKKNVLGKSNVLNPNLRPPIVDGNFNLVLNFTEDGNDTERETGGKKDS